MATSGSYNFGMTGADIIQEALELLGVAGAGNTVSAEDQASCLRALNARVKTLQAAGVGLWKNVEASLIQSENGYFYSIGPTGDHCSTAMYKTELAVAGAAAASTITVDSDDNITNGDHIGIELNDGTVQWTLVNGVPSANVVTLTAALTGATAIDNHVYNYTSKMPRPIEIVEARRHDSSDRDTSLIIVSRDEYIGLSNKTDTGTPSQVYYDPVLTNGKLYVWPACSDVKEYIKFTARIPIEDFDVATNDPDFPQEWLLALAWDLAVHVAPKFGKVLDQAFVMRAQALIDSVRGWDRENVSSYIGAESWR